MKQRLYPSCIRSLFSMHSRCDLPIKTQGLHHRTPQILCLESLGIFSLSCVFGEIRMIVLVYETAGLTTIKLWKSIRLVLFDGGWWGQLWYHSGITPNWKHTIHELHLSLMLFGHDVVVGVYGDLRAGVAKML